MTPCGARGPVLNALEINANAPAAGEPGLPGGLVRDPELQHPGPSVGDHVHGFRDDRTLDAAARDGTEEIGVMVDDEMAAHGTGRGSPGLDDGGHRNAPAGALPG